MSESVCPKCLKAGRYLVETSKGAKVDYYRCDHCGHVWCLDPKQPRSVRDITYRTPKAS